MTMTARKDRQQRRGERSAENEQRRAPSPQSVAAMTAMPPPCGVGWRCEERAFGLRQRVALQNGMQDDDQADADECGQDRNRRAAESP